MERMTRDQPPSVSLIKQSFSTTLSPNGESKSFVQRTRIESSDIVSNFMQESQLRFNQLLEERGFSPIPPPAGFGTPTRPGSLLKDSNNKDINSPNCSDGNWDPELPTSPLSPPSPFQHPFFRRQLVGGNTDPWARFSGFGRLTPLISQHQKEFSDKRFSQTFDLHMRKSDSDILDGRNVKIHHIRTTSADELESSHRGEEKDVLVVEGKQHECSPKSGIRYHTTGLISYSSFSGHPEQSHSMCRNSQFYSQSFGEGVSETESEEDDLEDPNTPVSSPGQHPDSRRGALLSHKMRSSSRDVDSSGRERSCSRRRKSSGSERSSSVNRVNSFATIDRPRRRRRSSKKIYGSTDELRNSEEFSEDLRNRGEFSEELRNRGECPEELRNRGELRNDSHLHLKFRNQGSSLDQSYTNSKYVLPSESSQSSLDSYSQRRSLDLEKASNEMRSPNVNSILYYKREDFKNKTSEGKDAQKRNNQECNNNNKDCDNTNAGAPPWLRQCSKDSVLDADKESDPKKSKSYRIALELSTTEENYVKVLHLIDQVFQFRVDQENKVHHMFAPDTVPQMFSNVKSIYKLHNDFLLPQLKERLKNWETDPRIGDIMVKLAPFLKMYTEYVRNFDHAMTLINTWHTKCSRFSRLMTDIQQMECCGQLTLQHHMLSPVQRIPRYEMLLRDYLRKLPTDHIDRHDTTKALHLVATAATHANEAMKKIDKFTRLLEVQENVVGCVDLVSPTRELIKQGKIIKISARSGDHQERYLYLLSDLLLLCSHRLGGRVMHGPQHKLRARYNVENLHVVEGDNLETAHTFYIRDSSKTVELYTQTLEEKEAWLAALFCAIEDTYRKKSSLKLSGTPVPDDGVNTPCSGETVLGDEAPSLLPMDGVTKCMLCTVQFSMVRRKHHCRACGKVVCHKCSSHKAVLQYDTSRSLKVCRQCQEQLSGGNDTPVEEEGRDSSASSRVSAPQGSDILFKSTRGVLEVSATAPGAVIAGSLQLKTHRKAWQTRWFTLHSDFVLYSFESSGDESALTATPVPGYTVTTLQTNSRSDSSHVCEKDRERAFKVHYSKKQYFFLAKDKEECARWVLQLQRASRAEVTPPEETE